MRVQLIVPENTMIAPEIFDQLLSAYGATAVVLFAIPLALGLIGYVVPLQIGARGIAFPRLGALSFWLYLAGGITLYASFLYQPAGRRHQSAAAAVGHGLLADRRRRRLDRRRRARDARVRAASRST